MNETIRQSESVVALTKALIAAKKKFETVEKNQSNAFYGGSRYADLSSLIEATEPALLDNDLVILQFPFSGDAETVGTVTRLTHSSGEFIETELTLPGKGKGKDGAPKFDAQTIGSAITYARRYAYQAILSVAADADDDGNAASSEPQQTQSNRLPPQPPSQAVKGKPGRPTLKANIPDPPKAAENTPVIAAPVAEKTNSSENEQPPQTSTITSTTTSTIPTDEQRQGYYTRARVISKKLEESGNLKADANGSVGSQIAKYFFLSSGTDDLKNMTTAQWDTALTALEKVDNETAAKLIKEKSVKI